MLPIVGSHLPVVNQKFEFERIYFHHPVCEIQKNGRIMTYSIGTTRLLDIAVPAVQHVRIKYTTSVVSKGLNNTNNVLSYKVNFTTIV